jgi:Nuclease subunit of the excinuclease complex
MLGWIFPVCGLAKRLEEIWLPDADYPVILPRSSEALFMLQRVRDEAHRVAIQYQRSTRKRSLRSELVDIPGVGESMAQALLKTFGSVAAVRNAEVDQLRRVPGIGPALAERIYSSLHSGAKAP